MNERVFVDSSAYYALTDLHDENHSAAVLVAQQLGRVGGELYTSNFVVAETHGLLLNRLDRATAERVLDRIYAGATRVMRASERDETRARAIIHQLRDKEYSLVDAISVAVMERLHLHSAWTYDAHFAQSGFRRLT